MDRFIHITGKGAGLFKPDMTRVTLTIVTLEDKYIDSLNKHNDKVDLLKKNLIEVGLEKSLIKTTSYSVDAEYETHYDDNHNSTREFLGYETKQSFAIEFKRDADFLGNVLEAISSSDSAPYVGITYFVKDEESAKNDVLTTAIRDSKIKAELLAKSAGVDLDEIVNINYTWGRVRFETNKFIMGMGCDDDDYELDAGFLGSKMAFSRSFDFEPEDISINEEVTVSWTIKNKI